MDTTNGKYILSKTKCLLSVASNLLLAFVNASLLLHSFLKFTAKTRYVWQAVIVAISQQIRNIKIAANSHYVCQGTYMHNSYMHMLLLIYPFV